MRGLFEAMKAETIPIGERLIAQETGLDKLFADHKVTPELWPPPRPRSAALKPSCATLISDITSRLSRCCNRRKYNAMPNCADAAEGNQKHHRH